MGVGIPGVVDLACAWAWLRVGYDCVGAIDMTLVLAGICLAAPKAAPAAISVGVAKPLLRAAWSATASHTARYIPPIAVIRNHLSRGINSGPKGHCIIR